MGGDVIELLISYSIYGLSLTSFVMYLIPPNTIKTIPYYF